MKVKDLKRCAALLTADKDDCRLELVAHNKPIPDGAVILGRIGQWELVATSHTKEAPDEISSNR